jgi:hypothetical protein
MIEIRVSVGHLLRAASRFGNAQIALNAARSFGTGEDIGAAQEELDCAKASLDSLHELLADENTVLTLPNLRQQI